MMSPTHLCGSRVRPSKKIEKIPDQIVLVEVVVGGVKMLVLVAVEVMVVVVVVAIGGSDCGRRHIDGYDGGGGGGRSRWG